MCAVVNVVPPSILVRAFMVLSVRSPLTVTPVSRLLTLAVMRSVSPPVMLSVPPLIVPPLSVHEPVALLRL